MVEIFKPIYKLLVAALRVDKLLAQFTPNVFLHNSLILNYLKSPISLFLPTPPFGVFLLKNKSA